MGLMNVITEFGEIMRAAGIVHPVFYVDRDVMPVLMDPALRLTTTGVDVPEWALDVRWLLGVVGDVAVAEVQPRWISDSERDKADVAKIIGAKMTEESVERTRATLGVRNQPAQGKTPLELALDILNGGISDCRIAAIDLERAIDPVLLPATPEPTMEDPKSCAPNQSPVVKLVDEAYAEVAKITALLRELNKRCEV